MPKNEGFLGKHTLDGDKVYTTEHAPVILQGKLKPSAGNIPAGSVLTVNAAGEVGVISASSTLQIVGVAIEDISSDDTQKYIEYLAHGTVKADKLKGAAGAKYTALATLQAAGIYGI